MTPFSTVLPEKLTGRQLAKWFSAFYGARRFIIVVTQARYLSLSWARWIQSILILSPWLCLCFLSGLFPDPYAPGSNNCAYGNGKHGTVAVTLVCNSIAVIKHRISDRWASCTHIRDKKCTQNVGCQAWTDKPRGEYSVIVLVEKYLSFLSAPILY